MGFRPGIFVWHVPVCTGCHGSVYVCQYMYVIQRQIQKCLEEENHFPFIPNSAEREGTYLNWEGDRKE